MLNKWISRLRTKPDDDMELVQGIAKAVTALRRIRPDWQRIEILRTADGISFATTPPIWTGDTGDQS